MAPPFLCDAQYYGALPVEGALSPNMLTSLAESVLESHQEKSNGAKWKLSQIPQGEKCQLQIDEERLQFMLNRKDEGFESDPESSSSHEAPRGTHEIKVPSDHVLRLEKLLRQDSGIHRSFSNTSEDTTTCSLTSSSGAESEEEAASLTPREPTPIRADFGSTDSFMMCDILFCHVLTGKPKVVIVVVKSVESGRITAHVFQCLSSEAARTLYSSYHSASSKYKLNRYRNSRRKSDAEESSPNTIQVSIRNQVDRDFVMTRQNSSEDSTYKHKQFPTDDRPKGYPISIDSSNVNIIEVRNNKDTRTGPLQRNAVTRIDIDSAPCSLPPETISSYSKYIGEDRTMLPALERLSIHSSNNPDSYLNYVGVSSSCPNSLIITSREIAAAAERERKARQREPPLYIQEEQKKLETFNKKQNRRKSQRRNRSKSEERRSETPSAFGTESNRASLHHYNNPVSVTKSWPTDEAIIMPLYERQSRSRNTSRSRDAGRARSSHGKRPAPPPPPRRHPNNPSLILVPTKTGQENTKSYYPKESHITRENKVVRIDHPIYPPWNMNSDVNNNPQRVYYAPPGWMGSHEYHSSRRSDFYSSELRKRSRSKSPARKPAGNRYMDAVSTFSLSQKIKDFSGSVLQSIKNNQNPLVKDDFKFPLKKNKKTELSKEEVLRPAMKKTKRDENRRVTFNSYATVQVMD